MFFGSESRMAWKSRKKARKSGMEMREYHSIHGAKRGTQGWEMAWFLPEAGTSMRGKSIHIMHKSRSSYFIKCSHELFRNFRYTYTLKRKTRQN